MRGKGWVRFSGEHQAGEHVETVKDAKLLIYSECDEDTLEDFQLGGDRT